MIILGIIATIATFGFFTGLIFIFFKKTRKTGIRVAPIGLVLALCIFYIMGTLNPDSHKSKTKDVATVTENTTTDEPSKEEESFDSEDDDTINHKVEWSVSKDNVKFSIDQVSIVKQDLESGDQGMIGVHFIIDNKSNHFNLPVSRYFTH